MSKHNYINAAFCQSSEFYPIPSANIKDRVEFSCNRSFPSNYGSNVTLSCNCSLHTHSNLSQIKRKAAPLPTSQSTGNRKDCEKYSSSDHHCLVCIERLPLRGGTVPNLSSLKSHDLLGNQHKNSFHKYKYVKNVLKEENEEKEQKNKTNSFFLESTKTVEPFTSLPVTFEEALIPARKKRRVSLRDHPDTQDLNEYKISNAFASDFKSESFILVDKNTNQCYELVPTSENEELVDDNREIVQMCNGQVHRYAIIPSEDLVHDHLNKDLILKEGEDKNGEKETCLSNHDLLNNTEQFKMVTNNSQYDFVLNSKAKKASSSMINLTSYPNTPMKNQIATKMLHDLLSTPSRNNVIRETLRSYSPTSRNSMNSNSHRNSCRYQDLRNLQSLKPALLHKNPQLSFQCSNYESIKSNADKKTLDKALQCENEYSPVGMQSRVDTMRSELPLQLVEDEHCNSSTQHQKGVKNKFFYSHKLAQATITLAIISLMLVLSSSMNLGLILYMIAHLGKSFYLQFSLVAALCGIGLGILGFRSRHCERLPNRSYLSGYVLVTMLCLLKCCGLLVILVLEPYPGLPLHDVTTGIILGLSTFAMFFIGLGVIGSVCCYHPPPDNRINVV